MRVWIPIFIWEDKKGRTHYDVHGVEGQMVSNKCLREGMEADMVGCFFYDCDKYPEKLENGRLHWIQMEVSEFGGALCVDKLKTHTTKKLMPQESLDEQTAREQPLPGGGG